MCLDVGLFGFILFGTPWTSWIWMPVSFPRVENFSTLIFSNKYSAHYSLLFLEPITCESWPAWWCSISFLSYLHFPFWSFLLFTALIGWVTLPCLWGHWFLLHLFCCLNHLFYFSVPLLLFSSLWLLFGTFLHFLFIEILILFILLLSLMNIFMTMILISPQVNNLSLFLFIKIFSWGFNLAFCLFVCLQHIPLFLHFPWLCVDSYGSDSTLASLRLDRVLSYGRIVSASFSPAPALGCLWNLCDGSSRLFNF